jgi:hypothetical protein
MSRKECVRMLLSPNWMYCLSIYLKELRKTRIVGDLAESRKGYIWNIIRSPEPVCIENEQNCSLFFDNMCEVTWFWKTAVSENCNIWKCCQQTELNKRWVLDTTENQIRSFPKKRLIHISNTWIINCNMTIQLIPSSSQDIILRQSQWRRIWDPGLFTAVNINEYCLLVLDAV